MFGSLIRLRLLVVLVRRFRSHLSLLIDLIEQILGLCRLPARIPPICLLRCDDLFIGLLSQPLRRLQVRLLLPANVIHGLLCNSHTSTG